MGYALYDSNGYITDFASIGGLSDFAQWAKEQGSQPLVSFVQRGWSEDLMPLHDALNSAVTQDHDIESARSLLSQSARSAQDILILSDGASSDDELKDLGGKGSGNFGHAGRPGERGGSGDASTFEERASSAEKNVHPGQLNWKSRPDLLAGRATMVRSDGKEVPVSHIAHPWEKDKHVADMMSQYVTLDKKPTGEIDRALEKAIAMGDKAPYDLLSHRGLSADSKTLAQLKEGAVFTFGHASSFTDSESAAWKFTGAAQKSYRKQEGSTPVLIRALIPKGTKLAWTHSLGVGQEHLLSGKQRFVVRSVENLRTGRRVSIEVLQ